MFFRVAVCLHILEYIYSRDKIVLLQSLIWNEFAGVIKQLIVSNWHLRADRTLQIIGLSATSLIRNVCDTIVLLDQHIISCSTNCITQIK